MTEDPRSLIDEANGWYTICENQLSERALRVKRLADALAAASHEFCVCAAIVTEDGSVYRGHRHDDALATAGKVRQASGDEGKRYRYTPSSQGFITSRGRYVDRYEAARIQRAAGIKSVDKNSVDFPTELYSEDLY